MKTAYQERIISHPDLRALKAPVYRWASLSGAWLREWRERKSWENTLSLRMRIYQLHYCMHRNQSSKNPSMRLAI